LLLTVVFLVFHEQVQLIVVHEGSSGYEWISAVKPTEKPPVSWLKTRAEIARYLNARESYDPTLYSYQAREVALMSSPSVFSDYEQAQDSHEKNSPVRELGARGYRTVKILNVLRIDAIPEKPTPGVHHENLAEVSFELEDHFLETNQVVKKPYTAMVSWRYEGVPKDPERLFKNWDGFQVVKYQIQPVIENIPL
jgi:type IV secretion system protein VirB8